MKTMKKTITVGVVGCGYWGPNLVRNLRQSGDCHLKVLCDSSETRLAHMRRLHPEVATTHQFSDLLQDAEIDALVIATPVRFHYEMAKAALTAGKHVFIEKPMARTVAEGEELVKLADQQRLVLMVGHTFLFSPAVRRMKEIIDAGDIGEVQYIAARRLNLGLFQKDINVAWDLAPHDISIVLHLLEELPVSVSCQGSNHVTRGVEDVTMMYMNFRKNRCAFVHNSWLDPKKVRQMTVVGSQRMIVYDDTEPLEKLKIYDARLDFLVCIRGEATPLSNGHLVLEVVRILEAASESLRQRGAAVSLGTTLPWNNGHGNGNGNGNGNGHKPLSVPKDDRNLVAA